MIDVAQRRFGPLVALVLLGVAVVLARMVQVQVDQHEVWAREAANLVREGHTLPYHRGAILDRNGQVIVRDDDAYVVELVYRDFRRYHPLGQVAHARAALEMREVSLHGAAQELERWAFALLDTRPADLERFEQGAAWTVGDLSIAAGDPELERRSGRAGELRFYVPGLLGLDRHGLAALSRAARKTGRERRWIELGAEVLELSEAELRARLAQRWRESVERLTELAWRLGIEDAEGLPPLAPADACARLLEFLQSQRDGIDDSVAGELFRRAAGFPAARIEPSLFARSFDLDWIADSLRWSPERTELWLARLRSDHASDWRGLFVDVAVLRAGLRSSAEPPLERLLSELALLYSGPALARGAPAEERTPWTEVREIAVLSELESLFEGVEAPAQEEVALPFQDPALRDPRALVEALCAPFVVLADDAPADAWRAPADAAEAVARLANLVAPREDAPREWDADREPLGRWFADAFERRYQAALAAQLDALVAAHGGAPLELAAWRLERARETHAYVVRDRSSRPAVVDEHPNYDVVYLLTRHPESLRGFRVRETARRIAVATDALGGPVAPELVGEVRESTLEEVLSQREHERRLFDLRRQRVRSEDEVDEMTELVGDLYRSDEMHGSSGIEGLYDDWLRGENGYVEREGLEERAERGGRTFQKDPVDGRDLALTLDLELQDAALRTLLHPELPADESHRDEAWFSSPVGAIVMITPDGEVLAAASVPREPQLVAPGRDGQAALVVERTLRRPTFQPVGSVFKPFVAAYALDRLGLDPTELVTCAPRTELDGAAGYGNVRCHKKSGHGRVDLAEAIEHSCNSYFAWLGEQLGSKEHVGALCGVFGFGERTGVCDSGYGEGLREDWRMDSLVRFERFDARQLQQAGNGLNVIEGTPMQVARATAGLATGVLPELRFDRPCPARPARMGERLAISAAALERVRSAMLAVVRTGSAADARLGEADLGFTLAAKTGSADYRAMNEGVAATLFSPSEMPDSRKHTWLTGWFPAEAPVAVVVIYLHDVGFTSSHTAVHVASQFLRTPAVQRFVQESNP